MILILAKLLLALAPSTFIGWLTLRLCEGATPVLRSMERAVLGFVLGITGTMYITFLAHIAGIIDFTRTQFLAVQIALIGLLAFLSTRRSNTFSIRSLHLPRAPRFPHLPRRQTVLIAILGFILVLKILAGFTFLTLTPTYQDDVFNNWNMRGKAFFVHKELRLSIAFEKDEFSSGGIHSYPPTLPMIKTFLAATWGEWDEGLVNSVHMLWYLSSLSLLFFALARCSSTLWSLIGVYILGSLPLYLMHGSVPYADAFLSVHIFAAVSMLFHAAGEHDAQKRWSYLKIGALAAGLLVFTKNEALVLHLPVLLLLLLALLWHWKDRSITLRTLLWYGICLALIALPWIGFKWAHGLTFGNAKALTEQTIAWQGLVPISLWVNTFFEGNWLLLFPLFFGLLLTQWRMAFKSPLAVLTVFFLIVYLSQVLLFLFTGLAIEATRQTGYARGIIHLIPVIVMATTLLLSGLFVKPRQLTLAAFSGHGRLAHAALAFLRRLTAAASSRSK